MMAQEMNKLYYYLDKSMQQIGPMRQEELLTLKQTGTISEKTLVWTEGLEKWVPLSTQLSPDETNASVKENPKRRHNTPTGTHQKRSGTSRRFLTFLGIVALVGIVGLVIILGKTAKQASAEELFQEGRRYAKQDDYASAVAKFRAAAEQGHARAQNNLGCYYAEGRGVAQDLEQAVSWLHKAAEQGDAIAQFNLGGHYASGQGVAQDWDQAVFWYRKAAEQGQARAQNNLGCYYAEGRGVAQDLEQAVSWWRKAAEQGDANAQCNLGGCYAEGQGVAQDLEQAVSWWRKAAEQGHTNAQKQLGDCYRTGQGVAQDWSQAVAWYRKAAEQGDAIAQNVIGYCYEQGLGVAQNLEQAASWYGKAAEQGDDVSQCNLGYCYQVGMGVEQNWDQAVFWYRKAAEQGYARAQYNLGGCYAGGQGVAQDLEQAVSWFRKAAEQGHAYAQYDLGCCYADGQGVAQDLEQAVSWCRKAAEQGLPAAQYNLGGCYYNGTGTNVDYSEAARWFSKAEEGGIEDARRYYDLAIAQLNSANSSLSTTDGAGDSKEQNYLDNNYQIALKYETGQGRTKDIKEAEQLYREGAQKNHVESALALCRLLEKQHRKNAQTRNLEAERYAVFALSQGEEEALTILQQLLKGNESLANKESTVALYNNSKYYIQTGQYDKAESSLIESSNRGNKKAQYKCGQCHLSGKYGWDKDAVMAFSYFALSAAQGYAQAQYQLGLMFQNGTACIQDEYMAWNLFKKAAAQGNSRAQDKLNSYKKIPVARRHKETTVNTQPVNRSESTASKAELSNAEKLQRIRIAAVSFEDTPIEDALDFLRAEGNKAGISLNIVFSPSGTPPCIPQMHLTNVTAEEFLKNICSVTKCELRIEAHAVIISSNGGADSSASYNNEDDDDMDF